VGTVFQGKQPETNTGWKESETKVRKKETIIPSKGKGRRVDGRVGRTAPTKGRRRSGKIASRRLGKKRRDRSGA